MPTYRQGSHVKIPSLIDDEDIQERCRNFIRSQKPDDRSIYCFKYWIENELLPTVTGVTKIAVCNNTAKSWMFELGFFMTEVKKGLYFDGHQREDVVKYRKKYLSHLMSVFEGDMIEIEPVLTPGQKKIIMINHDKSRIAANDGKKTLYLEESENILQKKGAGTCLMVSGCLCPCHG